MRTAVLLIISLLICFKGYSAPDTRIIIIDQDNQPVINAVVSIPAQSVTPDVNDIAIMDQVDKQFSPNVLVVHKGQKVSFPNSDNIRHHVYSFSAIKPFEIRLYKGSSEEPILFDKSGLAVLGCNIHDNMVGYIYVADQELAKVTDSAGSVKVSASDITEVVIWHPDLGVGSAQKQRLQLKPTKGTMVGQVKLNKVTERNQKKTFKSRKFGQ
ncbi:methylamine utilization protein [Alteromonas ponticola]|uniref:Methylamine utilization protein n=1 Tax=Alteromonas aquimaris TaxID=2998417 RepID=A0ABT3PCL1_9ALTE|nr:methylamine utilization protein [Alteromonas aquimaris]MCW8109861.1 methylamine utilization protein [Alteromonas aquimaris]